MIQSRASERANQIESNRIKAIDRRDATRPTDRPNPTDRRPSTTDRRRRGDPSVSRVIHPFIHSLIHPSASSSIHPTDDRARRSAPTAPRVRHGWMDGFCVCFSLSCVCVSTYSCAYVQYSTRTCPPGGDTKKCIRDETRLDETRLDRGRDRGCRDRRDATRREPPRVESESNE